ncbi:MAG: hypothetical protein IPG35_15160 [Flavobacteriales bacterium]|nr:hypothetical protein [Flavobacteriales bacterium]
MKDFRRRWAFDQSDAQRWEDFKNRFMNSFADEVGMHFVSCDESEAEFHRIVGVHRRVREKEDPWEITIERRMVGSSSVYGILLATSSYQTLVLMVQAVFWVTALNEANKENLRMRLMEDIQLSGVPISVAGKGGKVRLFPSGAAELDDALISQVLMWLEDVPGARERFATALSLYGKPDHVRDVADNLRRSLEETLRHVLGNTKSLENQKSELGTFLKKLGVAPEVANGYWQLIDLYSKFQNDRVKHGDKVLEKEIELVLYLTGTFIRFLLTLSN